MPVKLQIGHDETLANLRFVGKLSELTPDAALSGKVEVSAPDVATMARGLGAGDLPPLAAQALSLNAETSASATEFGVNKLSLRIGDMSFAGAIHGSLIPTPAFDIVLNSSHLDIDRLLSPPAPKAPVAAAGESRPYVAETKIAQPSKADGANTPFTLPAGMTATFDFGIETASYKGGVVRNIALRGGLDKGVVALQTLSADLPGNSNVTLTGRVVAADGLPQFTGNIAAGSDNLRSLVQWLGVAPAALPADRLRNFSIKSKIQATPKAASITDIAMHLDASRISGGLALELRDKPGIGLRLAIDKLNLDAYLSKDGQETAKKVPAVATKPRLNPLAGPSRRRRRQPSRAATAALNDLFDAIDANVDVTAGRLTVAGETARQVKLDLTIFDRAITLRDASVADFAGLAASLAGTVSAKGGKPAFSIDHAIALRDPARFARFSGTSLPTSPAHLGKISSNGRLDGNLSRLKTDIRLKAIGATTRIRGALLQPLANPSVDLLVSLKHPELLTFIQKFSADYRPAARKLGPLSLNTTVHGTAASLTVDNIDIKAGPVAATGAIKTDLAGKRRKIDLNLKTSEVLLDLFLPPSPPPPSTRQTRSLSASGGARATISRDRGGIPAQRWSTAPIALPMPTDIDADAQIEMAALTISDISLKTPKVKAVIRNGRLAVENFTAASLFGGVVSGKAVVQPSGRNGATLASELSVDKVDSRLAVKTLTGHDRVQGPLSFKANIATEGNSEASFVSGLNGNASVSGQAQVLLKKSERNQIRAVSVGGNLLAGLLGEKVSGLQRLAPLTQLMASLDQAFGRNPAQLSGDIRITRGVLRTDNLKLSGQGHVATTSTTVDLPRWDFNLTTELVDDPRQMPLVMFSATGPIDAPSKTRVGGRLLGQGAASAEETATNPLQQVLPGLLGGSTGGSPQTEGQNKVNPGKLLEGIFKQFQR